MYDSQRGVVYWDEALRTIKDGELDLENLITMRVTLDDLPEIFPNYNYKDWIKVIVEP
jgi:threonine dehydrogenase-like Zn-dependent dehydrogenase